MKSTELRVKELLREKGWTTKILAEKTGLSESYLTHIKNGTRRWNEDALRKLAHAFELTPVDLFSQRRRRTDNVDRNVVLPEVSSVELKIQIIPLVGAIPATPNPYNNQVMQEQTGFRDQFVPALNSKDTGMFAYVVPDSGLSPLFSKGDILIVSPLAAVRSGDVAAVELGGENPVRLIVRVTYSDEFIVIESIGRKQAPTALVRGKDTFKIIGRVVERQQRLV